MTDLLIGITMFLPLLTAALFGHAARRWPDARRFFLPLAAGWIAGLLGSFVWSVHDMLSATPLPAFSWVDGFFVSRDLLHIFAFSRLAPAPLPRRHAILLGCAVLIASLAALAGYAGLDASGRPVSPNYWGGAIYPVLGVAVLSLALLRWRATEDPLLRRTAGWVTLSLLIYFAANVAQFISLAVTQSGSALALFLWPLSDLIALTGALSLLRERPL